MSDYFTTGWRLLATSDDPPMTEAQAQAVWDAFKRERPHDYARLCEVLWRALDAAAAADAEAERAA